MKKLVQTQEFFEGFKSPEYYSAVGDVDWDFDMDRVSTNLLVINNEVADIIIKQIQNIYGDEGFAVVTKTQGQNYCLVMTLSNTDICLHHNISLKEVSQLLDDSTSTNDCLRAFEMAQELDLDKEVFDLLKSQLSPQGEQYMRQYRPDLLE